MKNMIGRVFDKNGNLVSYADRDGYWERWRRDKYGNVKDKWITMLLNLL